MDRYRFDEISRVLGARATRRGALGVVAGAAGLGASALAWLGDAGARKKKKNRKKKPGGCRVWVLAGEAGPDASLRVDDDITVSVNGRVVAKDDDGQFSEVGPFTFSARRGDKLRIVANDVGAGWHELDPLYLRCASGGSARKLSDGFPRTEGYPEPVGIFFDETFTI